MHPLTPARLLHVIANQCAHWCGNPPPPLPMVSCAETSLQTHLRHRLLHVIASQCAHWRGNPRPRRETWQVGTTFGKSVALFRIRPKYCFLSCPAAGEADCHVAPLLAMTCRNMRLSAVATAWCQANLSRFRIRPRRYFLLCPAAGNADCHVASLLAMTRREALAPADTCPSSACHCEPVRTLVWQSASPQGKLTSWQYFGRIRTHLRIRPKCCLFSPISAGLRIATSLRSSQ